MASFNMTLKNEELNISNAIDIPEGVTILDAANEAGIRLPFLCRTGDCSSCICKLVSGNVSHGSQTILNESLLSQGFILACCAMPLSDIVVETHKEKEFRKAGR
jgi:ferredoxin